MSKVGFFGITAQGPDSCFAENTLSLVGSFDAEDAEALRASFLKVAGEPGTITPSQLPLVISGFFNGRAPPATDLDMLAGELGDKDPISWTDLLEALTSVQGGARARLARAHEGLGVA